MEDLRMTSSKMSTEEVKEMWKRLSPDIRDRYNEDYRYFVQFCDARGWSPAPASWETIFAFIKRLDQDLRQPFETIVSKLSVIASIYRVNRFSDPPQNDEALWLTRQIARTRHNAKCKKTIFTADIKKMVEHMRLDFSNRAARDKAVILVGYVASMSPRELALLRIADITPNENGVLLRFGQRPPFLLEHEEDSDFCPVCSLSLCIAWSSEFGGYAFHQLDRYDWFRPEGLSEGCIRTILRRRLSEVGVDPSSVDVLRLGRFTELNGGGRSPA
jgi:hypothetical protein